MTAPTIETFRRMLDDENGLAVVSSVQADGRVLSSVVNCGVLDDPDTGAATVAFVSNGRAARNGHLRRGSAATVVARRGWEWVGVTGPARLIGPDDPAIGFDAERIRLLLRSIFHAAGGTHDDLEEFDRVMQAERRAAVFVSPDRIIGNASPAR